MPQGPPCDCTRVPAGLALDCQIINDAWRLLGGEDGAGPTTSPAPPIAAAFPALPQPFKLEIVQICDIEDPDGRNLYLWDCDD